MHFITIYDIKDGMDFRHIQHFIQTAELGSLTKAARRLNIVQPALSQSIKRLESELGVSLFTRSRKGMALTEAGVQFQDYAYGILNQFNRAKESLAASADVPSGTVSVAMTASASKVLALPLWDSLVDSFPNISLNLEEGLAGNIQRDFEAGRYDLIISYLTEDPDRIRYEPLIEEKLYLVEAFNPIAQNPLLSGGELAQYDLILPQAQHGVGRYEGRGKGASSVKLRPSRISASLHTTLQLVLEGKGATLLPWSAIFDHVESNRLSAREIIAPGLSHQINMLYPSNKPLTPATRAVMSQIKTGVKNAHEAGLWRGKLLLG